MACACDTYSCLDVAVNPCNTGTGLGVTAATSGNYLIRIEFNGMWNNLSVLATEDMELSVPTFVLNENYVHEIIITNPGGNISCYNANTYLSFNVAGYTPVPPDNDTWQWGELDVSGDTVVSNLLAGDLSPIIWINQNPTDWEDVGITHDPESGTLDFTAIGGVIGKIIFQYKNLA